MNSAQGGNPMNQILSQMDSLSQIMQSISPQQESLEGQVNQRHRQRNNAVQRIDNLIIEHGETVFQNQEVVESTANRIGTLIISNYRIKFIPTPAPDPNTLEHLDVYQIEFG
mmetsp:Transcript_47996/g.35194  ORF Transcript_47996/g.35194 Transcript_47996/m.35194 type:complete len:112 (+) Transcript_47996:78-413(+)